MIDALPLSMVHVHSRTGIDVLVPRGNKSTGLGEDKSHRSYQISPRMDKAEKEEASGKNVASLLYSSVLPQYLKTGTDFTHSI